MNRLWRGAFKSALRAESICKKKDKIKSSVTKEVIWNQERRIHCCKHRAKILQPPYTHAPSSWCLRFWLVIPPSHCDISMPMISCHFPGNKYTWFLVMSFPTCTQLFNPLSFPFVEAVIPVLKTGVFLQAWGTSFLYQNFPISFYIEEVMANSSARSSPGIRDAI